MQELKSSDGNNLTATRSRDAGAENATSIRGKKSSPIKIILNGNR